MSVHRLTVFQREQVEQLLSAAMQVYLDDPCPRLKPWGILQAYMLTVLDWKQARQVLSDRTDEFFHDKSNRRSNQRITALDKLSDSIYYANAPYLIRKPA